MELIPNDATYVKIAGILKVDRGTLLDAMEELGLLDNLVGVVRGHRFIAKSNVSFSYDLVKMKIDGSVVILDTEPGVNHISGFPLTTDQRKELEARLKQPIQREEPVSDCGIHDWSQVVSKGECNVLTPEMREVILAIFRKHKDLVYYHSHKGDAVKNTRAARYDYLTPEFKALSYDDKIEALKRHGLRSIDGINFKQWPLQQWGKNIMRYAKLTKKHLFYVQSDLNYCSYPSMFAEAMCSSGMFTGHKYYPRSGWHFFGPQMDLFCTGNWSIEEEVRQLLPRHIELFDAGPDQWWNMTDGFLVDFYRAGGVVPDWMLYPASVWHNADLPVKSFSGTLQATGGPPVPFQNVKTTTELEHYSGNTHATIYSIFLNGVYYRFVVGLKEIPLSRIIGDVDGNLQVFARSHMSTNQTDQYDLKQDVIFDGTLKSPRVIIGDETFNVK